MSWKTTAMSGLGTLRGSCLSFGALGLLLAFAAPAAAQFGPAPSYGTATRVQQHPNPRTVSVADLDGDGDLDLAVPSFASGGVVISLGNGTGGFVNQPIQLTAAQAMSAAVGFVNGDAIPDLVVTHFLPTANIYVLIGNGDGTYTATAGSPLSAGTNAVGLALADINNDTFLDIVATNDGSNNVSVFLGNGTGAFGAAINFPAGLAPRAVAVADLNGDGRKDIVVANYNGAAPTPNNVSVLLSTAIAPPAFAAPVNYTTDTGCRSILLVDLNGDTRPDIVTGNEVGANVSVLLGNANGSFQDATNYPAAVGGAAFGVVAADFNGDGKLDVGVANHNLTTITLFNGDGTGDLQTPGTTFASGPTAPVNPAFIGAGDFNADGKVDLAVSNFGDDSLGILLNIINTNADLAITKTGPASVALGANLVYTITVTNNGPNTATAVSVADATPAGLTFVSNANACTTAFPCAIGPMTSGQVKTITTTYSVPANYAGANPIQNTATVSSSTNSDPTPGNNSATANTPVPVSDLAITKTGPATVAPGSGAGNLVYTITVTNNGPSTATTVSVADTTPTGLTFVSNAGACTTAFPCAALGPMTSGQSKVITATYTVPAGYAGANPILNTATVSASSLDGTPANNSATASTSVSNSELAITKTGPASVQVGQNVVYTITVTNNGPDTAPAVSVADTTPAGLTFVSNAGACTTAFPCAALGPMTSGQSKVITSTYTVPAAYAGVSPIVNTATVSPTDATPANNSATASTTVTFLSNLGITKTGPANVTPGSGAGNVVYTVTVTNSGPSTATNVSVADTTPAGLTFVSNTGACTSTYPCGIGPMTSGQSKVITSTYTVPAGYSGASPILNTATVSSTSATDTDASNNTATASTTVLRPDLGITKTGPATVQPGQNVVYTITVTNNGTANATSVSVADTTPAGLTFVSNTGNCTTAFPCALGTMAAGASRTITATYTVPAGYTGADPILNTATVSSSVTDPTPADNTATASTAVGSGDVFYTVAPCRIVDTRDLATGGPKLDGGSTRTFKLTGAPCNIPTTAKGVSINVTVTQTTAAGDLRIYPNGSPLPDASIINFSPDQTRANNGVIQLGAGGEIAVLCEQAAGTTVEFILDVNGYFE